MRAKSLLHLVAALLLGCVPHLALAQQAVAGKDYRLIDPAQQTQPAKKVQVLEFFSYGCPHCAEFEPRLQEWVKRQKDIDFKMVPMVFREAWRPTAKLYYSLEAMGLLEKYHMKVFDAIHKGGKELSSDQAVKDWAKSAGIDATKFNQVYESFGIRTKVERSVAMGRAYGVQFTPSLAVNGKYFTGPSMVQAAGGGLDYNRFFAVVDELIDREQGKPTANRKP
jgi:thiol:disulfide interchange protein DsbA